MKTPIPVTLDDLQATARDDRERSCTYRNIAVFWDPQNNCFGYMIDGWRATEDMVTAKLKEYVK